MNYVRTRLASTRFWASKSRRLANSKGLDLAVFLSPEFSVFRL
jgi:hypothetical protein